MPRRCLAPCINTDEHEIKPDPPPPRYPHWTENPSYCNHCSKKTTRVSVVKSSPIIFIPEKGPRKSRVKDTTSSLRDIRKNKKKCSKTDIQTRISSQVRKSVMSTCMPQRAIENKCADSLALPARVDRTKQEIQRFPTLTKEGQCRVKKPEKKLVMSNVSDCKPNVASFKYRLSKCPCPREIQNADADHKSPINVGMQQRQSDPLSRDKGTNELESRRETVKRKRKGDKLRSEMQQKYRVRRKMSQKGDKRLDPRPSRIAEPRQPRDGKMRSRLSKQVRSESEEGKLPSRLRNLCSDYCPSEEPVVEHKSYPTKMDESRAIRDQSLEKSSCAKRR